MEVREVNSDRRASLRDRSVSRSYLLRTARILDSSELQKCLPDTFSRRPRILRRLETLRRRPSVVALQGETLRANPAVDRAQSVSRRDRSWNRLSWLC